MSGIGMIGRPGPWAGSMVAAVAVASAGVAASAAPATGRPAMPFAVRPSGASLATAYVVNTGSNSVTPISTATNRAGPPVAVGRQPMSIATGP